MRPRAKVTIDIWYPAESRIWGIDWDYYQNERPWPSHRGPL